MGGSSPKEQIGDNRKAERVDQLRRRYGSVGAIDESDTWTDEDFKDLTAAVLRHEDQAV